MPLQTLYELSGSDLETPNIFGAAISRWHHEHTWSVSDRLSRTSLRGYYPVGGQLEADTASKLWSLLAKRVFAAAQNRQEEEERRQYALPLSEAFKVANVEYPSITVTEKVMAGAPCVGQTRVPVYMVLDAIEGYADLESVRECYPDLTIEQIREAIGFAKTVVECPVEHKAATASR